MAKRCFSKMKIIRKSDGSELEVISYGKFKEGDKWLNTYTCIDTSGVKVTQVCECISDYFEPKDEESRRLFNDTWISSLIEKVDKILNILIKHTDPEEIAKENCNDFLMNIIANLVAKRLEKILKI